MIIGISGKSHAGKDETGKIIKELFADKNFVIKKYADKLKEITALLLGVPREKLEDQEYKATPLSKDWWIYEGKDVGCTDIMSYEEGKKMFGDNENFLIKTTPRWLLQHIGTDCFRELIHPDVWVNSTFADYDESKNIVLTDVRFKNEADAVKKRNGLLIRIKRPTDDYTITHPSETQLDNYDGFDVIINNDGTIEDLKGKVKDQLSVFF